MIYLSIFHLCILHWRLREHYRFFDSQARRGRRYPPKAWRQLGLFHRVTHFKVIGLFLMSQHGLLSFAWCSSERSFATSRSSSIVRTWMCKDFKSCDRNSALLCRYWLANKLALSCVRYVQTEWWQKLILIQINKAAALVILEITYLFMKMCIAVYLHLRQRNTGG